MKTLSVRRPTGRHHDPSMASRYHYLDAARGILMMLGIVYHAARAYGDAGWIVSNPETHAAFDYLAAAVRSFRMPAFFLMSGFFAALTLHKYGPAPFLRKRMPRIVVPFVTVLFTLNVAQLYVFQSYSGTAAASQSVADLWHGVPIDFWISHLWFLVCLAYYFIATAVGATLIHSHRGPSSTTLARVALLADRPAICLLLLPLGNLAIVVLFGAFPVLYTVRPLINLDTLVGYVPFFAAGLIVFASARLYESLTRFRASAVALTAAALLFQLTPVDPGNGPVERLLAAYRDSLATWIAVYWVLVFFRTILDRPSRTSALLADAAYTIYLLHHLTVILIAWWLSHIDLAIGVKFVIVLITTFALTLGVHVFVIRPVPLLTFLFNGRWPEPGGLRMRHLLQDEHARRKH